MTYSKYGAKKTEVDGFVFASKREAARYSELKLLERAGEIKKLELQPKFDLMVKNIHVAYYIADFMYFDEKDRLVVEDVKGVKTDVYRLKKKLMKVLLDIDITEVK